MQNNQTQSKKTFRLAPDDDIASHIARPARAVSTLFSGWGPKLMAATLAASALGLSSSAAFAFTTGDEAQACSAPDRAAAVLASPAAEWPQSALGETALGPVVLTVDLGEDAAIRNITLAQSSGSIALDREAMRVARSSTFAPAIANCRPSAASYSFVVDFPQ